MWDRQARWARGMQAGFAEVVWVVAVVVEGEAVYSAC